MTTDWDMSVRRRLDACVDECGKRYWAKSGPTTTMALQFLADAMDRTNRRLERLREEVESLQDSLLETDGGGSGTGSGTTPTCGSTGDGRPTTEPLPGPLYPDHCLECLELMTETYGGVKRCKCVECVCAARKKKERDDG